MNSTTLSLDGSTTNLSKMEFTRTLNMSAPNPKWAKGTTGTLIHRTDPTTWWAAEHGMTKDYWHPCKLKINMLGILTTYHVSYFKRFDLWMGPQFGLVSLNWDMLATIHRGSQCEMVVIVVVLSHPPKHIKINIKMDLWGDLSANQPQSYRQQFSTRPPNLSCYKS